MIKIITLLIILNGVHSIAPLTNLIVNGNFETPSINITYAQLSMINGWTGKIDIGQGSSYNIGWSSQVALLANNNFMLQNIQLNVKGQYFLIYQCGATQGFPLQMSKMNVYWNSIQIDSVVLTNYSISMRKKIVQGINTNNQLSFEGIGLSSAVGITVDNIELYQIIIPLDGNYIVNGDFENPSLGGLLYNFYNNILGWDGYLEIGVSNLLYNSLWMTQSQVLDLDGFSNELITQNILLTSQGNYSLTFQYAPTYNHLLNSTKANVYWNGNLIQFIQPNDYLVHNNELIVLGKIGKNVLGLEGAGVSDGYGLTIDNVALYLLTCLNGSYYDSNSCHPCLSSCITCNNATACIQYLPSPSNATNNQTNLKNQTQTYISIVQMTAVIFNLPTIRTFFQRYSIVFFATDKIWFYQYHNRQYGEKMTNLFNNIRYIESYRFIPSDITEIQSSMFKWTNLIEQSFNFSIYQNYTQAKYLQLQQKDGTFINASLDYYLKSIPITLTTFIILSVLFYSLRDYQVSIYLRRYSFVGFIYVVLFSPNIQQFAFLSANQMRCLFSGNFNVKLLMVGWILMFYLVVLFCFSFPLLVYNFYKNLSKYYNERCYATLPSFLWLIFQLSHLFLLGIIHSALYYSYDIQMSAIICMQILSIAVSIYFWKSFQCFRSELAHFANILIHCAFIIVSVCLLIDSLLPQQLHSFMDAINQTAVAILVGFVVLQIVSNVAIDLFGLTKQQQTQSEQHIKSQKVLNGKQIVKPVSVKANNRQLQPIEQEKQQYDESKQSHNQNDKQIQIINLDQQMQHINQPSNEKSQINKEIDQIYDRYLHISKLIKREQTNDKQKQQLSNNKAKKRVYFKN